EENRSAISGSTLLEFTSVLGSETLDVSGIEPEKSALYNSGLLTFSTLSGSFDGVVKILDLAASGIHSSIQSSDFETSLKRSGIVVSGSRFLHRREL
ncbi:MAG: hypothetical protein DRQ40_06240, partial [Gammaproteobacteria bacterium]